MSSAGSLAAIILPYVPDLAPLLADRDVTEIMVNADRSVYEERRGQLVGRPDVILTERGLRTAIENIASDCNQRISSERPRLSARLEDGSRVACVFPPCSVGGPTLTIRKFPRRFTLDELVAVGMLSTDLAEHLAGELASGSNMLIAGAPGAGKTALLNALLATVPMETRVGIIEDTAEIFLDRPNKFTFEARPALQLTDEAPEAVTIGQLVRESLRHRGDLLVLGEIRGEEAWQLLQVLNTGHRGSVSTLHANSAPDALVRFADMVLMAGMALPYANVLRNISRVIRTVVFVAREPVSHTRRVTERLTVEGFDMHTQEFRGELVPVEPETNPRPTQEGTMHPTPRLALLATVALVASMLLTACGGDSPSGPSNTSTNRLAGTWRGDLVITRTGQPAARSATQWTFSGTGVQLDATIQITDPILPTRTIQAATAVMASQTLPAEVTTTGTFLCPGAAPALFSSRGQMTDDQHITASFHGVDCASSPFDGQVALTR